MTFERDREALPRKYVTQYDMSRLSHKLKFIRVINLIITLWLAKLRNYIQYT